DGRWLSAHRRPALGHALVRGNPHGADLRRRRADHWFDLGQGLLGSLVGVERADARLLRDRAAAVRHLSAAALLDRGSGASVALRERVRDRRGGVRAAELHRRAPGSGVRPPPRADAHRRQSARLDAAHVPTCPGGHHIAVHNAVEVRDGGQERPHPGPSAAAHAARRRRCDAAGRAERVALVTSLLATAPALPLHTAGKYVAGAYVVFMAIVLIYVGIMAVRLQRTERDLTELRRDLEAAARDREREVEHVG